MSLLMDALKKAEQAKRLAREQGGGLELAPTESVPGTSAELPTASAKLPLTIDPLPVETPAANSPEAITRNMASPGLAIPDSDFLGHDALPPRPSMAPKLEPLAERSEVGRAEAARNAPAGQAKPAAPAPRVTDNEAIRNVFAAKNKRSESGARWGLIGAGVAALLLVAGGGAYVWREMQPRGLAALPAAGSAPISPPPTAAPPFTPPVVSSPAAVAPGAPPTARAETPAEPPRGPVPPAPSFSTRVAAPPAEDAPVLQRSRAPLRVSPQLQAGYEALGRGDLEAARVAYEQAWKADPQNSDALHGLAAIAIKLDQPERAEQWLQLALRANPKDGAALSGLTELYARANPASAEGRLRAIAAEYPELAAPQVALGNLYSRQARWHEAQEAYFAAYALQPANADVLFNLAVSLEHLNQPKLAHRYYVEALKSHQRAPGRFDAQRAQERVRELAWQ